MPLWKLILFWPWYGTVGLLKVLREDQIARSVLGMLFSMAATVIFGVLGASLLGGGVIWAGVLLLVCCWVSIGLMIKAMQSMP